MALSASALTFKTRKAEDFSQIVALLAQPPFWSKKNVWKQMEQRAIPVSVTHDGLWSFKGAGLAQVPPSFAVEKAKEFERLSQVPEHFPEIRFDPETSTLHLKVIFLKHEKPLDLQLFEEKAGEETRLFFRSVGTWLHDLEGVVIFKDHERQRTEVGILAQYQGEVPWVPNWLFQVSAEAVMHHVAEQLRKGLETDYKK